MFSNSYKISLVRSLLIKSNKNVRKNITKEIHRNTRPSAVEPSKMSFSVFSSNPETLLANYTIRILSNKYVSKSDEKPTCWSCEKVNCINTNPIFCMHCNTIQEPNRDENYFKVIGIDIEYDLNQENLTKKYKDLQKLLHPDKFSIRAETEQKISAEYSSLVNKAYATLAQPLSRGIYLLRLKGLEISEETQVESAFLHQIMERNEEVESAETPEEILQINRQNKAAISELVGKLAAAFKTNDLSTAKNILIHMKYFISIEQQIKDIIRKMGIVE